MFKNHRSALIAAPSLLAIALLTPAHANAQTASGSDDIVVSAHALRDMGLMAGSIEIEGDALIRAQAPQIGEVLAHMPGVSATGFAPGASRPVLRGLTGDRVQVLIDGIGAMDASSVSADHGVALDTLTIDHIDVLHGPAVLAYGGQAIGGAVIAYDKRIPRRVPDAPLALTAIGGLSSVTQGGNAAASVDVRLGGGIVAHADASWHEDGDLRIGGDVLSAPLKSEVLALAAAARSDGDLSEASELEDQAMQRGKVANSFARGTTFGGGLAWLGDGGNLGVSVQRIDRRYGIPSRPGVGEEGVSIDLHQTRFDLRGEIKTAGFLESITLRGAYADYGHSELEADGAVGTLFARKSGEARIELIQADHGGWTGRSGVQFATGKLTVTGDEAILPANRDRRLGLFTLQQHRFGKLQLELAGRVERVSIRASDADFDRSFTLLSGAAGLSFKPFEALKLGINYAHAERAPSPEELLTNGLHLATQSFEIGDPDFSKERSDGAEVYVKYDSPATKLSVSAYLTKFTGFITPVPTGANVEGFPVYAYRQLPARFAGFEIQGSQRLTAWGDDTLTLEASADYVHARLSDGNPVPRIPPLRIMGGLEYAASRFSLRGDIEWNARQTRVGPFESATSSFAVASASATWRPMGESGPLTLIVAANNLFNANGRRAASVTRDFVPVAGRDFRLTARLTI